jgi:fido (protein-threonine AMPylation protein)
MIKIPNIKITDEEIKFLRESNAIEEEYSQEALEDAIIAWTFAKAELAKNKGQMNINFLLEIHKRLMTRLNPRIAGLIRENAVYIGGECRDQSKDEIIEELNNLFNQWNKRQFITGNSASTEKLEKHIKSEWVRKWHIQFEAIHPHEDGNGRTGRILMNLQRLDLGLPILIIYDREKSKYYEWFRK